MGSLHKTKVHEHAESVTQRTDRVQKEFTGDPVHVDESAMTVRRIFFLACMLSVLCCQQFLFL